MSYELFTHLAGMIPSLPPVLARPMNKSQDAIGAGKFATKWSELGFSAAVLARHPDLVQFLFDSGFAFSIAMYRNTREAGKVQHGVFIGEGGEAWIRVEGKLRPWTEIKGQIVFDHAIGKVISKNHPEEAWNYISPDGLVPRDRFSGVYPVERLNQEELADLQAHARTFWETNPEIDPGEEKPCLFQLVTTKRTYMGRNWFTENFIDAMPEHAAIRVIDANGSVYSFGFEMRKEEHAFLASNFPRHVLSTTTVYATTPDYEESRGKFDVRSVTTFPLSIRRKEDILEFVKGVNREGACFNFYKQNCNKFAGIVLRKAGVELSLRRTLADSLWRIVPTFERIPVIGPFFTQVAKQVSASVQPIVHAITNAVPKTWQRTIAKAHNDLCSRIKAFAMNAFILFLGADKHSSTVDSQREDERIEDDRLVFFKRIMSPPADLFSGENVDLYLTYAFLDWQRQQKTTVDYFDEGRPKLYLFPPK